MVEIRTDSGNVFQESLAPEGAQRASAQGKADRTAGNSATLGGVGALKVQNETHFVPPPFRSL